jgi:hypothetical protein
VAKLRRGIERFDVEERFLVERLEGLERLASLVPSTGE